MDQTFAAFLRTRANRNFRALLSEIQGVTSGEAFQFRHSNWPDHRWGVGQDGSIAGIAYHVAAWKQMTLPVFDPGGRPQTRAEFDEFEAPPRDDWAAIEVWLQEIGEKWNSHLFALTDEEFNLRRDWEGTLLPISTFVVEMMEHDVQHASQIAYIKQRIVVG